MEFCHPGEGNVERRPCSRFSRPVVLSGYLTSVTQALRRIGGGTFQQERQIF